MSEEAISEETARGRRAAAMKRIEPVLEQLHVLATCDNPTLRPLPLMAIATLGHPKLLPDLVEAAKQSGTRDRARDALIRFETEAALDVLLRLADGTSDPDFRMQTIEKLGAVALPASTQKLLELTRHEDPLRRAAAARGLSKKRGPEVESRMLDLLDDEDKQVGVAALLALRDVGTESSTVPLLRLLTSSKDVFIRSTAIMTLGRLAPDEAHAAVRGLVQDPDDRIRASAIEALGYGLDRNLDDVPLLVNALKDPANRVRGNAIVGLWSVDQDICRKPFAELMNSPKKIFRSTAAWVIGQVQAPELFHAYLPVINTEVDSDVLAMAHRSIQESDNPRLVGEISKLLVHPNKELRLSASKAFAKLATLKDRPTLLQALIKERDPVVKAGMLSTLGKLSDGTNFPDIFPFLDEKDPRVKANALEALGRVGDLAVVPILRDNLETRPPRAKANAIVALVRVGELDILPHLGEMLTASDVDTVGSACFGAETIGEDLRGAIAGTAEFPPLDAALDSDAENLAEDELTILADAVREADQTEDWEFALARALAAPSAANFRDLPPGTPAATLGSYMATRMLGGDIDAASEEAYRRDHFAPGLFLALEKARTAIEKDTQHIQHRYLDLARAQLDIYREFLDRAAERVDEGQDAQVFKMFGFFFKLLKLSPDVHRTFAMQYLAEKEYDLAYEHLLRAHAGDPENLELLVQAAGAAIRIRKSSMARALLEAVQARVPAGSPLMARVEGLMKIVDKA